MDLDPPLLGIDRPHPGIAARILHHRRLPVPAPGRQYSTGPFSTSTRQMGLPGACGNRSMQCPSRRHGGAAPPAIAPEGDCR